jgi:hypothetical protein
LEYHELQEIISSTQVDDEAKDSWHYTRGTTLSRHQDFTTTISTTFSLQDLLFGFGIPAAQIKLKFSPGSSLWIG